MVHRNVSGDNKQRRDQAREARERGESAGEAGASTGASQQRKEVDEDAGHEERLAQKNKNKQPSITQDQNEPRPGSLD